MADTTATVDVSTISDPDTRRALRGLLQVNQHLQAKVAQQQQEIEALLQVLLEKHVTSMSEFKIHMTRTQSGEARSERLHGQLTPAARPAPAQAAPAPAQPAPRPPRQQYADPEIDRPRRYTL